MGDGHTGSREGACALPVSFDELWKVATGHPHAVATGQQPQDGNLIQQLPQKAECHVEVHGEQTCGEVEASRGCQEGALFPEHFHKFTHQHIPMTMKRTETP